MKRNLGASWNGARQASVSRRPLLVAIALGMPAFSRAASSSSKPGMVAKRRVEQAEEDLVAFRGEHVPRFLQMVPVDHDLERRPGRQAHHGVFEFRRERASPPRQQFGSRQGVDVLGVEHQAVHIEGDCEHEGMKVDEG